MRRLLQAVAVGLVFAVSINFMTGFAKECGDIRDKVLRLHVLANSDTEEDQQLKLQVRDAVLAETDTLFYALEDKGQAMEITEAHLAEIERIAAEEIALQGYDYPVQAEITNMFFETRQYESFQLPAGRYDTVRITIGEAEGQNWWCVLYPTLCLPAAEEPELSEVFGEAGADIVENSENYKIEFAFLSWIEQVKEWFSR